MNAVEALLTVAITVAYLNIILLWFVIRQAQRWSRTVSTSKAR